MIESIVFASGRVTVMFTHTLTFEDIQSASDTVARHPEFSEITQQLWVYPSHERIEIDINRLQGLIDSVSHLEIPEDMKLAIVADSNLGYGLSRMYEALSDGAGWETRVFRERGEAETWLESSR